jgi:hypothetical protein
MLLVRVCSAYEEMYISVQFFVQFTGEFEIAYDSKSFYTFCV